jgi:hypothetical protein
MFLLFWLPDSDGRTNDGFSPIRPQLGDLASRVRIGDSGTRQVTTSLTPFISCSRSAHYLHHPARSSQNSARISPALYQRACAFKSRTSSLDQGFLIGALVFLVLAPSLPIVSDDPARAFAAADEPGVRWAKSARSCGGMSRPARA